MTSLDPRSQSGGAPFSFMTSQYRATLPQQQRRLRSQILGCRAVNDRRSRRRVEDVPIVRVFLPKSRPPSSNGLRLRPSPAVMTLKSGFQMVAGARFVQARTTELRKFWVGLAIIDARLENAVADGFPL
jgi:hypothetical protein